ncbi:MAG: helix-turn-helix transcriptional regulator [Euryarchaeota archaeon]|nr:helix-turn-helix transcriptional regulator [Euryarchaeota archaeon]
MTRRDLSVLPTCAMAREPGDICPCSLEGVVQVLGKKWSILIVGTLGNHGRLRFNDLMRKLGGVSPKSLTERLRELEREGLVARISLSGRPPRVEYQLTAEGRTMWRSMLPMMRWALRRDHRRAPSGT